LFEIFTVFDICAVGAEFGAVGAIFGAVGAIFGAVGAIFGAVVHGFFLFK
jgi:hypothetical protein